MGLLVVLNELSHPALEEPSPSVQSGGAAIDGLVTILRRLRAHRPDFALITDAPLPLLMTHLCPTWQPDSRNRDKRQFLKQLAAKSPFTSITAHDDQECIQYKMKGQEARGLGAAHLVDGLGLSLNLYPLWDLSAVELARSVLDEDDEGALKLIEDTVNVKHVSTADHVEGHRSWLCQRGLQDLHSGVQLWVEREAHFPDLRFLPRVEAQIHGLQPLALHAVKRLLAAFQSAVTDWRSVRAVTGPTWPGKVTPEHEQRRKLCWFNDPATGRQELFDTHMRYTPGAGRLHFRWDATGEVVVVAHIGQKLGM
ncbi:MAG: hypothetical protein GXX79_19045 [Actinomycetales bacterium]|nr:hypothetical protein [Actinomycetales bacterium]